MSNEMLKLENRINKIKEKLLKFENFRSGSLSEQYNVCGKANCRCKDKKNPKKHGPYYQASFYINGKHSTFFVREENVKAIKDEIKNYKIIKSLIDEWVNLNTLMSNQRFAKK